MLESYAKFASENFDEWKKLNSSEQILNYIKNTKNFYLKKIFQEIFFNNNSEDFIKFCQGKSYKEVFENYYVYFLAKNKKLTSTCKNSKNLINNFCEKLNKHKISSDEDFLSLFKKEEDFNNISDQDFRLKILMQKPPEGFVKLGVMGDFFMKEESNYEEVQKENNSTIICNDWTADFKGKNITNDTDLSQNINWEKTLSGTNDGNPVGYVLNIPKNPKAILIDFYGGWEKKDLKERGGIQYMDHLESFLFNKDIVIVNLQLADLYKNDKFQMDMDENIDHDIINGVKSFIEALKNGIQFRHNGKDIVNQNQKDAVEKLKKLPVFLNGVSFGGRTVARVLQSIDKNKEYKNVKGGISWCGGLDMNNSSDRKKRVMNDYLDPTHYIDKLNRSMLLIASAHDNNVALSQSIVDFEKKIPKDKKDLISTYVSPIGDLTTKDYINIGHFMKDNDQALYQVILGFINDHLNGEKSSFNTQTAVGKFRLHKIQKMYGPLTNNKTTFWEEFQTYALREEEKIRRKEKKIPEIDFVWNSIYGPLFFECLVRREKTQKIFGYLNPFDPEAFKDIGTVYALLGTDSLKAWFDNLPKNTKAEYLKSIKDFYKKLINKNEYINVEMVDKILSTIKDGEKESIYSLKPLNNFSLLDDLYFKAIGKVIFEEFKDKSIFQKIIKKIKTIMSSNLEQSDDLDQVAINIHNMDNKILISKQKEKLNEYFDEMKNLSENVAKDFGEKVHKKSLNDFKDRKETSSFKEFASQYKKQKENKISDSSSIKSEK